TATDDLGHTALVTASDSANYLSANAHTANDKQLGFGICRFDVGTDLALKKVLVGTEVDFRGIVTNTTDQVLTLTGVTVSDNNGPNLTGGSISLNQSATSTFSGSITRAHIHSLPTRRSSDLTATDDLGHTALVTASDSANYL